MWTILAILTTIVCVRKKMQDNNNNNDENDEEENRIRPFEFQRKILPWGDLDTAVEDMLLSNNQNSQQISSRKTRKEFALSRRKQEIIVIASLDQRAL